MAGEHSPDVAGTEIFFQNNFFKNESLRIGSVHSEMLIEFIIKNKIKSNFSKSNQIIYI